MFLIFISRITAFFLFVAVRFYTFGIGPEACPNLVQGVAGAGKGQAHFIAEDERMPVKVNSIFRENRGRACYREQRHIPGICCKDMSQGLAGVGKGQAHFIVASHEGVCRRARISFLPTNVCSTENNIPFPLIYSRGK